MWRDKGFSVAILAISAHKIMANLWRNRGHSVATGPLDAHSPGMGQEPRQGVSRLCGRVGIGHPRTTLHGLPRSPLFGPPPADFLRATEKP